VATVRWLVRGMVSPHIAGWQQQPLQLDVDLEHGGRWTSLRTADREWLWSRPDPRRNGVRTGDAFVDAGGLEECFPTVRGTPDHGWAWTMPWSGADHDAHVAADGVRLRRRLDLDGGAVTARYDVVGPPGQPFVHAAHALLDLGVDAYLDSPARRVRVFDDPRPLGAETSWPGTPVDTDWPDPWGLPLHRFGPDDGTAVGFLLETGEVTVVDGEHALTWQSEGLPSHAIAVWRNLGGFPKGDGYRSIGVEPIVGAGFDWCEPGHAAKIPAGGTVSWTVRCTARRRQP
jgi:hypothetical protein